MVEPSLYFATCQKHTAYIDISKHVENLQRMQTRRGPFVDSGHITSRSSTQFWNQLCKHLFAAIYWVIVTTYMPGSVTPLEFESFESIYRIVKSSTLTCFNCALGVSIGKGSHFQQPLNTQGLLSILTFCHQAFTILLPKAAPDSNPKRLLACSHETLQHLWFCAQSSQMPGSTFRRHQSYPN